MSNTQRQAPLRVDIYCRVSTDDQENNTSLEQQEIDGRKYAESHGMLVMRVFKETFTASLWRERKQLMEMRERWQTGQIDAVIFRTFDRLSREPAHYYILTEDMKEHGIEVHCVKEQHDNSVFGQLLRTFLISFAKLEREKIHERTATGKRARVTQKNMYLAGNKPPYGYHFSDEKTKAHLVINQQEAKVVREIFQWYASGMSIRKISALLSERGTPNPSGGYEWYARTISVIIDRGEDLYGGKAYAYKNKHERVYKHGKCVTTSEIRPIEERIPVADGVVPRIVEDALIQAALQRRETNKQDAPRNNQAPESAFLRAGFLKCGHCGSTMVAKQGKIITRTNGEKVRRPPFYGCGGMMQIPKCCPGTKISVRLVDGGVWDYLCGLIDNLTIVEEAVKVLLGQDMFAGEEKSILKALDECKQVIEGYRQDLRRPGLNLHTRTTILEDMNAQCDLLTGLEKDLEAVRKGRINHAALMQEYQSFIDWCQDFKGSQEEASYDEKRRALRFFGVTAYVYREEVRPDRYEIRVAPPTIIKAMNILPTEEGSIGEPSSE